MPAQTRLLLAACSNRLGRLRLSEGRRERSAAILLGGSIGVMGWTAASDGGGGSRALCEEDTVREASKGSVRREQVSRVHSSIIGNYENRMKFFAPPEKVFEYYASVECSDDGGGRPGRWAMTYSDFMQSIIPFTFQEVYYEVDPKEHLRALALFDLDGDGFLQFDEFLILSAIVTTKLSTIEQVFRRLSVDEGSKEGELSRRGFIELMTLLVKGSPRGGKWASAGVSAAAACVEPASCRRQVLPDPRKVSDNRPLGSIIEGSALVARLFPTTEGRLSIETLLTLLREVEEEVLYYEFASHGDVQGQGPTACISAREFAGLLVGLVHPGRMEALAKRVRGLQWEGMSRILFGAVKEFDRCLDSVSQDASQSGEGRQEQGDARISREEFLTLLLRRRKGDQDQISEADISAVVDVLFKVLDKDGNGVLDEKEFFGLLRQRSERWVQPPPLVMRFMDLLHTLFNN